MADKIIPESTKVAAKRGFIRTSAQSLASLIPTATIAITLSGDWALGVALGAAGAVVTALLAGTASALSILANGIPADYVEAAVDQFVEERSSLDEPPA